MIARFLSKNSASPSAATPAACASVETFHGGTAADIFRSNASGADLNGAAYRLIGKLVYERMDRLGYFEEVRQELGLEKSTQELLKEDPDYFTKLINAN